MQLSKIERKKVSSYKKQAPRRAGSQGGFGLEHVMYNEMLQAGLLSPEKKRLRGISLLVATT